MTAAQFDLGKPSILRKNLAFGAVRTLLVEPDKEQAMLIKKILSALGCTQITTARSAEDAIAGLQVQSFDLAICNWELPAMSGLEFVSHVRRGVDNVASTLPLVLIGDRSAVRDVVSARDSGINEYIVRPFTSGAFLERLYMLAEQPRNFVLSRVFTGPNRRRLNPMKQLMSKEPNAAYTKRQPALVASRDILRQLPDDNRARLLLPDYSLKRKVGLHVPEELYALSLASEKGLSAARQAMLKRLQQEVMTMKQYAEALQEGKAGAQQAVRSLQQLVQMVAQESMLTNYYFATEIAELLLGFCVHFARWDDPNHQLVIAKHIEVLHTLFAQEFSEDGGHLGQEMLADLSRLIKKYAA